MDILKITVRAVGRDQFAGLKGHDYIRARNLTPKPNHYIEQCPHCSMMGKLKDVQNILEVHFSADSKPELRIAA